MKKILHISTLILVAGFLIFQSCEPPKKTPVIGLLMDQFNVERWASDTAYFMQAVKDMGGKAICLAANGDANKQMDQAKMLLAKGVDVIVILAVDTKKAADIVLMVKREPFKHIIAYDRLIQDSYVDYYVSFDNAKVGELQAEYIVTRLQKGNIALIGGPPTDQNSYYLRSGQLTSLQPYIERGDVKVVYNKMVDAWTMEEGYRLAKECLQDNQVDAVIAGNDLLARGVIKALQEKGLAGKVLVAGQDADSEARENIVLGLQTMSVYKPIADIATNAARMAVDLANGKDVPFANFSLNNGYKMVPSLLLCPIVVNKGNIGTEIISDKKAELTP
jgi:D-xylose transport system substrate-binding protein